MAPSTPTFSEAKPSSQKEFSQGEGEQRETAPRPTTQMTLGCIVIPLIVVILILGGFFYIRARATSELIVPDQDVVLVRTMPEGEAPLLARFGAGHTLTILGRTSDWRWLQVQLWAGQQGWIQRPLDILVWQIEAAPTTPEPVVTLPLPITPIEEMMIAIPATNFTMGSPPGLGEPDERPAHVVSLSAFSIDRTEVTVGQYWQCVVARACATPSNAASQAQPHYLNDPAFDNHPMINVPWTEANNYCLWRGKRLPTEAEWEAAASWHVEQHAKSFWTWGNEAESKQGNVGPGSLTEPVVGSSFAGDQSPSGVLDMAGNVSEWVFDWYKVDYYETADATDPTGPSQRRGEGSGRVVRGGSFADTDLAEARSANRRHLAEGYGYTTVGFRCVQGEN